MVTANIIYFIFCSSKTFLRSDSSTNHQWGLLRWVFNHRLMTIFCLPWAARRRKLLCRKSSKYCYLQQRKNRENSTDLFKEKFTSLKKSSYCK